MKTFFCLLFGFGAGYLASYLIHEGKPARKKGADWLVDDIERRFESLEVEPS